MESALFCNFKVCCPDAHPADSIGVCGDIDEFGKWNPENCLLLHTTADLFPTWVTQAPVPVAVGTLYKFVRRRASIDTLWEPINNREIQTVIAKQGVITFQVTFGIEGHMTEVPCEGLSVSTHDDDPEDTISEPVANEETLCGFVAGECDLPAHDKGEPVCQQQIMLEPVVHGDGLLELIACEEGLPTQLQGLPVAHDTTQQGLSNKRVIVSAAVLTVGSGIGGGVLGLATGGVIGGLMGLVPAIFTFGLSIPVGVAVGSVAGLSFGATSGGIAGAVGSWVMYSVRTKASLYGSSSEHSFLSAGGDQGSNECMGTKR